MLPFTRPTLGDEEITAVTDVLKSGWITSGPKVQQLEQAISDYLGGNLPVLLFNSATSALEATLLAYDIEPGDEVIVPAMSFVATANVVVRVGAKPVFVDVGLRSRNLDAESVRKAITPRTRAIIPVHFAGLAVDLDPIFELAKQYSLLVLEDAAQAIGTEYKGRKIGVTGNPVSFSFHPNKNMTTIEGGALVLEDTAKLRRLQRIRFHGIERDDEGIMTVPEWGGKMNLPDVGAALGLVQLAKLDGFNARRKKLAERYFSQLPDHDALVLPANGDGHSWHMFAVCIDGKKLPKPMSRKQIQDFFAERDIGLGMHYPAMHLFPFYRRLGYSKGDFPNAEQIGEQTWTLPLFPTMEDDDVDKVVSVVNALLNR
jgi:dTDP-4-amino-4,6-dideoxygalactose transaminase